MIKENWISLKTLMVIEFSPFFLLSLDDQSFYCLYVFLHKSCLTILVKLI